MTILTATEASQILRVSRDTIRRMIERGDLSGFQRGKITRVTRDSVERLVGEPIQVPEEGTLTVDR